MKPMTNRYYKSLAKCGKVEGKIKRRSTTKEENRSSVAESSKADYTILVEYSTTEALSDDLDDAVSDIEGTILAMTDNDEIEIGSLIATYFDAYAASATGYDLESALDEDASLWETGTRLYDLNTGEFEFNEKVQHCLNHDALLSNLLIIDRLEIVPRFRGYGIGLGVMCKTMQHFGRDCGVITLRDSLLQFDDCSQLSVAWFSAMGLDKPPKDEKRTEAILARNYESLGFSKLPGTNVYVLCPAHTIPTITQMKLPESSRYEI